MAGAILALLLGLLLPVLFMMGINDRTSGQQELLCYICFLSSTPAFVVAGRRPFIGASWLLVVGLICGGWMLAQMRLPPAQPLALMDIVSPLFWAADLPAIGGIVFFIIGWLYGSELGTTPQTEEI